MCTWNDLHNRENSYQRTVLYRIKLLHIRLGIYKGI